MNHLSRQFSFASNSTTTSTTNTTNTTTSTSVTTTTSPTCTTEPPVVHMSSSDGIIITRRRESYNSSQTNVEENNVNSLHVDSSFQRQIALRKLNTNSNSRKTSFRLSLRDLPSVHITSSDSTSNKTQRKSTSGQRSASADKTVLFSSAGENDCKTHRKLSFETPPHHETEPNERHHKPLVRHKSAPDNPSISIKVSPRIQKAYSVHSNLSHLLCLLTLFRQNSVCEFLNEGEGNEIDRINSTNLSGDASKSIRSLKKLSSTDKKGFLPILHVIHTQAENMLRACVLNYAELNLLEFNCEIANGETIEYQITTKQADKHPYDEDDQSIYWDTNRHFLILSLLTGKPEKFDLMSVKGFVNYINSRISDFYLPQFNLHTLWRLGIKCPQMEVGPLNLDQISKCDLNLGKINFIDQDLSGTNFTSANLHNATFNNVILKDVNFFEANLQGASFNRCDLSRVNFNTTNLSGVTITNSILDYADFSDAKMGNATLDKVTINGALFDGSKLDNATILLHLNMIWDYPTCVGLFDHSSGRKQTSTFTAIMSINDDFTNLKINIMEQCTRALENVEDIRCIKDSILDIYSKNNSFIKHSRTLRIFMDLKGYSPVYSLSYVKHNNFLSTTPRKSLSRSGSK